MGREARGAAIFRAGSGARQETRGASIMAENGAGLEAGGAAILIAGSGARQETRRANIRDDNGAGSEARGAASLTVLESGIAHCKGRSKSQS